MARGKVAKGGTYALLLRMVRESELSIGRLGSFRFPAGYYLYLGSALGSLRGRLARHSRPEKKLRWHIDYLLQKARLLEVWSVASEERLECLWAEVARGLPGAQVPIPRFGSSDCRCPSHLVSFAAKPDFALFKERLQACLPRAILVREVVER